MVAWIKILRCTGQVVHGDYQTDAGRHNVCAAVSWLTEHHGGSGYCPEAL